MQMTKNDVLFWAVKEGNVEILKILLQENDIDSITDKDDKTLLMYAAELGCLNVLTFLINEKRANVNAVNLRGETALLWGATHPNEESVVTLLAAGADINQADERGVSAMMVGVMNRNVRVVKKLCAKGAHLNAVDSEGKTALSYAIYNKDPEMTACLLKLGACPNVTDIQGMTPIMHAIDSYLKFPAEGKDVFVPDDIKCVSKILSLLHQAGAKLEYQCQDGNTVLHYAAEKGGASFCVLLMRLGCRDIYQNENGMFAHDMYNETQKDNSAWIRDIGIRIGHKNVNIVQSVKERYAGLSR